LRVLIILGFFCCGWKWRGFVLWVLALNRIFRCKKRKIDAKKLTMFIEI